MENYLNFSAPLRLRAASPERLPTRFEAVAYSGDVIEAAGVVIDLASTRLAERMPLLNEHDRDRITGVVETAAIQGGGRIVIGGRIFADLPGSAGEKIARLAQRGIEWQMSVGLYHYREDYIGRGATATVNSRTVAGPVTVLRDGIVRECSIVALGADGKTSARLFTPGGSRRSIDANARAIYQRMEEQRRMNAADRAL